MSRASVVAAGSVYQQGLSFTLGLIVARVIGAADYGIFTLARNLVDVTGVATRLGLDIGLQRYFGETNKAPNPAARQLLLCRVRLLAALMALLPVVAIGLGAGSVLEANVYTYSTFAEVLLCLALTLPFATDVAVLGGAYRGILRLNPSIMAECVLLPTIRLAAVVILFSAGWRLWAVVAGTTLASVIAAMFLAARARADFRGGAERLRTPWADAPWTDVLHVVRYSSVLALGVLVVTLMSSIDVLTLGHFSTAQDVGQYSLVKTLLFVMAVFGGSLSQGLGALIAERHSRGDQAGTAQIMSLIARWTTLAVVPLFSVFLFWGAELTSLFGPSFEASQTVVSWLAAGQLVFVVFGPCGWALSMTGRHVLELKILVTGLVVAAAICWFAVPVFGQLGAAIATFTAIALANLLRVLFVRRTLGAFPFGSDIILIAAAGVGPAWVCAEFVRQLSLPPGWNAAAGIACFAVAHCAICWMHVLNEAEKNGIHGTARQAARILMRNPIRLLDKPKELAK